VDRRQPLISPRDGTEAGSAGGRRLTVALVAPPLAGHQDPMAALATALTARGHRAIMIDTRATMPNFPTEGTLGVVRALAHSTEIILRDLPASLAAAEPDIVAVDQLTMAGGLVAAHLGLPFVSVANGLPIDREPRLPPYFIDWRYDPSFLGRWRNRGAWRVQRLLMRRVNLRIARQAAAWGLKARSVQDCLSPLASVAQTVNSFDYPRPDRAPHIHTVGPLRPAGSPSEEPGLPDEPFAFVSLGSLQGYRADLLGRLTAACDATGLRSVVAHGGHLSAADEAALPGRPVVRARVDQRAVLARAALCVCHGGMNTVMDAMAAGVPLVVVPLAYEQPAIAARVAYNGAGRRASSRWSAKRLARVIAEAATDPGTRAAARRIAADVAAAGGAARAAEIIETAALTLRPVVDVPPASPTTAHAA
jgi:zeaxanthin glucosyltransferase